MFSILILVAAPRFTETLTYNAHPEYNEENTAEASYNYTEHPFLSDDSLFAASADTDSEGQSQAADPAISGDPEIIIDQKSELSDNGGTKEASSESPAPKENSARLQENKPQVSDPAMEDSQGNEEPKGPHPGFVYISEVLPEAKLDIRYATDHNFTGRVVEGYLSDNVSLTKEAAGALKKASEELKIKGYGIIIYDAYRPKRAVDSFIKWGQEPEDNLTKDEFYPDFQKEQLFKLGYLAKRSAHSRGSTVDLTIYDLNTGDPVDMGSPYDFLGPVSNHGTSLITEAQTKNRNILKDAMKKAGFKELRTEWWHYELINEPYPDTFFDFVIQ